jgi:hypothetical protein
VWQLPGVVVVLDDVVVVCEPPAGSGTVLVELCDVVVDGGVVGVAGVVTVVLCVVVDAGGVVCASESGMVIAKLTQSAPAASNAFMDVPPGRKPARRYNPLPPALVAGLSQCPSRAARSGA